ncbi:hypothetical protein L873DRAFT_1714640 [Choiromyces venosus 120613-1]|uniref:RING-type domain-containing protein n=1 Tax=Choiromyces venosus 120613-1 TaxID=1336337 RepID=A0A3N4JBW5_9PEZI|nr:hypothetical protein L873DRAFT_1714640 [Choiromyces venosus 120613-1]
MGVVGGLHGRVAKDGRKELTIETNPKKDFKDDIIDDLNKDLQKLQKCVTCVICQDLLFEPFSLQCGHVFCYTCMVDWLGLYKKRTCPECRAVVKTQPAPAYLIRDMIETFVHRAELTSPHGTGSELRKQQREALVAIEKDRATEGKDNGGLFKGMFKKKKSNGLRGFTDPSDGITRCPNCNWEVEDGICTGCGGRVREPRGHAFSDSDEDESDDSDDDDSDDTGSDSANELGNQFARDLEQELDDEEDEDDDDEDDDDDSNDEDDDDEEADEWQDEEDAPGYNVESPERNNGQNGPSQPRVLFHRIHRAGPNRNMPTFRNAGQEFPMVNGFSVFPSSEAEGGGRSEEDTEGSLADFVEHDTPENRRRLQRGNTRNGDNNAFQQITINSSPILITSTPAASSAAPSRRRGRRVVLDDEDENDSSFFDASPGQARLRNINDFPAWPEDDVQQFGYSPLGEVTTASENDDDALSSPPSRRLRRGGPPSSSGGGGSVPSVPEEDEESGSGRFGDNDDSEDEDGDTVMTGVRSNARRGANGTNGQRRTQNKGGNRTQPVEVQDSDSDSDIQPRPARRNGRNHTSSGNRPTHGRNTVGNNRSTNSRGRFNPNLQNIFSAHHQQREQTQYDALGRFSVSPARSITPVQRQHTGESRRASTPLRSVEQNNPPMSPLIRLSNGPSNPASVQSQMLSSPPPFSPMQSPIQSPRPGRSSGLGPPAEHQIINNSRPILSNPPSDMPQAPRTGSIVAPHGLRVRGRNSRQQLRGASSRVGLRGGSTTPTQSITTGNLAARRQNTVSLERDAIFARGAAIRRQQVSPRDPAAAQLGRRNSRVSLNPNTTATTQSQNQNQNQPTAVAEECRVTTRSGQQQQQQVGSASGRIGVPIANGPVSQSSGGPLWALGGSDDG